MIVGRVISESKMRGLRLGGIEAGSCKKAKKKTPKKGY